MVSVPYLTYLTTLGLRHVVSRDTSPIIVSTIFGPALRLSSSRKFAALCYNRNRHCRAQPSGWLYTRSTQRLTRSWALKTIDLSRTTSRSRHPWRVLIRRVDTPQRKSHACSRTEGTFLVPVVVKIFVRRRKPERSEQTRDVHRCTSTCCIFILSIVISVVLEMHLRICKV